MVGQEVALALLLRKEVLASLLEGIQPGCELSALSPGWGCPFRSLMHFAIKVIIVFNGAVCIVHFDSHVSGESFKGVGVEMCK